MANGVLFHRFSRLWLLVVALVAALVAVAGVTPLRGQVVGDPTVFRPEHFVAVTVPDVTSGSSDDRRSGGRRSSDSGRGSRAAQNEQDNNLPQLGSLVQDARFGTPGDVTEPQEIAMASVAAAAEALHRNVRVPRVLPDGVSGDPDVAMYTAGSASYTLDLAKINDALTEAGVTDLQLPTALDGATIVLSVPAGVELEWGGDPSKLRLIEYGQPTLTVPGQIDVTTLRELLLARPEIIDAAPDLAAQLGAIEQWRTTVPVPVTSAQSTQAVQIGGSDGLLVSDPHHGAALIWAQRGTVYLLTAPASSGISSDGLIAVADSL